ncbi:CoA transferase [Sinomonas sp. ASV322]|uniref:CoA transferase n=1 Tax=Sinomonas sp. ASV322 TaxID=3041920 RepID=UPI0027DADD56|nr:CoA transferase [Sinomonas sp. ASV322]MDQ4503731.1 CoA transferase [Sinomonas sp. ASV322]
MLDVEALALGSVGALAEGLDAVVRSRNRRHKVTVSADLVAASFDSIRHLRVAGAPPKVWAPMSGFHSTRDGWVRLHANYPHHAARLLAALGIAAPDQLDAALRERTALDVEATVRAAGGVAAAVRTRHEWGASPMGLAAETEPWITFALDEVPVSSRRTLPATQDGNLPLDGVRILDFTRVIAGPSATRLLAALGADVLRVDPPQLPELLDQHLDTGFAKRSALADFTDAGQLASIRELASTADAVFLGYRRGALARYGLDAASLRRDYPHLAVVSLNAWGSAGPWSDGRGFDSIVQAACGIAHLYGATHDGAWRPGALPVQALDHATGMGMAAAAVALLAARRRGVGGSAHLSLVATANQLLSAAPPAFGGGRVEPPVPKRRVASAYGDLEFVPPPLLISGQQLEYPHPPELYGSSGLEWVPRT